MLSLLLAKKLFSPFSTRQTWNGLIVLVFGALTISISALLLAGALLESFHSETMATFQNIQSDLFVHLPTQKTLDLEQQKKIIEDTLGSASKAIDIAYDLPVIIANPGEEQYASARLQVKNFRCDPPLYQLPPQSSWAQETIPEKALFIGSGLAEELRIQEGEDLLIFTTKTYGTMNDPNYNPESQIATVAKIIKTGIDEIDDTLLLTNQTTFQIITQQIQPNYLHISLIKNTDLKTCTQKLQKQLTLPVHPWLDYYPTLQSALALEKTIFFIVTLFILGIVLCSLPSLLILLIEQKRSSISILLLNGIPARSIKTALVIFAAILIGAAQLFALAISLIISLTTHYIPIIPLPSNYYHTTLTLSLSPVTSLIIIGASTILGGLVIGFTTKSISHNAIKHFVKKGF